MSKLYVYQPSREADLLLAQLWGRMEVDGDLEQLYANPRFSLSMFFEGSMPPRHEMLYAVDEQGIWLAVWFDPVMAAAFYSAYVRPDYRGRICGVTMFRRIVRAGLQAYGTLVGITRHARLLPIHKALGYKEAGCIPALFPGGENGYIVTRVATEEEKARWHSLPRSEQEVGQPLAQEQPLEPLARPGLQERPAQVPPPPERELPEPLARLAVLPREPAPRVERLARLEPPPLPELLHLPQPEPSPPQPAKALVPRLVRERQRPRQQLAGLVRRSGPSSETV